MTEQEIKELAKSAAHSAVIAVQQPSEEKAVDMFIDSYIYALKKLRQKVQQTQRETTQEFGNNSVKFR